MRTDPEAGAEHVLVISGVSGVASGFGRGRRRRGRTERAEADAPAPTLPVTRATVIWPGRFGDTDQADHWLAGVRDDEALREDLVAEGLAIVNRALRAHAIASRDPHVGGVGPGGQVATRIGWGSGDELADGRWSEAVAVERAPGRRNRTEALRPQERMAAELSRREPADACEMLLLRARADLDGDRLREAALQLRVGLEALLAEVEAGDSADQAADLGALTESRKAIGDAANAALAGEPSAAQAESVAEALRLCERVLRRRRILAG